MEINRDGGEFKVESSTRPWLFQKGGLMKKKKSVGVTIFGYSFFIYPFWIFMELIDEGRFLTFSELMGIEFYILLSSCVSIIAIAIGILRLQNWARLICVYGSILFLIWGLYCGFSDANPFNFVGLAELCYFIYPLIISVPLLIFFTRPKVKEQFNN